MEYKPTHEELFQASRGKKRKCATSGMSIPQIKTTFSAPTEVIIPEPFKELEDEEPNLAYIIRLYPKEFSMNAIISPKDNPNLTRDARRGSRPLDHQTLLCGCTG